MARNLKLLLLAALVLSAAFINVVKADDGEEDEVEDDDENEREEDLGEGGRECGKIEGPGFRAFKVTRTETTETDSIVFSFRAFPVPRIRVRYFANEVEDAEVEDDDVEAKIDLVAAIPGFFLYNEVDGVAGFNPLTDTISQKFNLRRSNGRAWAKPVFTQEVVDGVLVNKLSVCRKVGDFCFDSYVANDTVTYEGYPLKKDSIKFNVIANPSAAAGLVIGDNERLAIFVKVHFKEGYEVEDNSEENEELEEEEKPVLTNDVLIGTDEISAYFNWEKSVTVTYANKTTADLRLISTTLNADDVAFDRKSDAPASGPGNPGPLDDYGVANSTDSDDDDDEDEEDEDFSDEEESDEEQEAEDEDDEYNDDEEDDAVKAYLDNDKIFVFAIDGSLASVTQVVWDPSAGPTTVTVSAPTSTTSTGSGSGVSAVSLSFQVFAAVIAVLAFLL